MRNHTPKTLFKVIFPSCKFTKTYESSQWREALQLLTVFKTICPFICVAITFKNSLRGELYSCENCTKSFAGSDQLKYHVISGVCSKSAELIGHMNTWWIPVMYRNYLCSILFYHICSMQDTWVNLLAKFLMINWLALKQF